MKLSARLQAERRHVKHSLADRVICDRCGAILATYADQCSADLADACPGFMAIEAARQKFNCDQAAISPTPLTKGTSNARLDSQR